MSRASPDAPLCIALHRIVAFLRLCYPVPPLGLFFLRSIAVVAGLELQVLVLLLKVLPLRSLTSQPIYYSTDPRARDQISAASALASRISCLPGMNSLRARPA